MPLTPGTQIGPYQVAAKIGVGGMGEVYRAFDTALDRDVAVKVLPGDVATDAERLARFAREAKTLAALNHPNIAQIYGVQDLPADAGSHGYALIMEFVEGSTLADRIAHGPMSLDEALSAAKQIAAALATAHEHAIVHRDLKPANIKVRPDGTVKVLDFGLAKVLESNDIADVTRSATTVLTGEGVVVGTPRYMSPEQATGAPVDKRTDIWAFGCVLFEMLAGSCAFGGDTASTVLTGVLTREPDWNLLPPAVPAPVRRLLHRCLRKDKAQRLSEIAAAQVLIEELGSMPALPAAPAPAPRVRTRYRIAAASALAVGVLTAGAAWIARGPDRGDGRGEAAPVVRSTLALTGQAALNVGGFDRDVVLAPDDSRIVYRGINKLLVRDLASLESRVLAEVRGPQGLFMSPDGQWVGFFDATNRLMKVPTGGGAVTRLTEESLKTLFPRGATWGPDIVYANQGLWSIPLSGGAPRQLTSIAPGEGEHVWPEYLPGGRLVLFTISAPQGRRVAVLDVSTRRYRTVLEGGSGARFVPGGYLLYAAGGRLMAVRFDPAAGTVTGTPVQVLDNAALLAAGSIDASISASGTLAYVGGSGSTGDPRSLVWVDRAGREEYLPVPPRVYQMARLSPDERSVALDIRDEENDIWVWALASKTLTRLTANVGNDMFPVWTPDSRRVIFQRATDRMDQRPLMRRVADGTSDAELLAARGVGRPYSITPDGGAFVFGQDNDLFALRLPAGSARVNAESAAATRLTSTAWAEQNGEVSPDGRWLAYQSNESGRDEVYVQSFPDLTRTRVQISTEGGRTPLWARNGAELFYGTLEGAVMSVAVGRGPTWSHGPAVQVVRAGYFHAGEVHRTFDVSRDGRRFLMIKQNDAAAARPLVLVQNWARELQRLAGR